MEFVYVVPRSDLFDLSFPQGFLAVDEAHDGLFDPERFLDAVRERGYFVERRRAEVDSSIKQIIPYTVVTHGQKILSLRRLTGGAEARLHGKGTVGVGGHVNPRDAEPDAPLGPMAGLAPRLGRCVAAAAWRELTEEVSIDVAERVVMAGFINDDSNEVGSVHFGLVLLAEASSQRVKILEPDQLTGGFVSPDRLSDSNHDLETWSRLVVDALFLGETSSQRRTNDQ